MIEKLIPVVLTLGWTVAVWFVMKKYLRASRAKKNTDAWIWLFVWCALIACTEWIVFFIYKIIG